MRPSFKGQSFRALLLAGAGLVLNSWSGNRDALLAQTTGPAPRREAGEAARPAPAAPAVPAVPFIAPSPVSPGRPGLEGSAATPTGGAPAPSPELPPAAPVQVPAPGTAARPGAPGAPAGILGELMAPPSDEDEFAELDARAASSAEEYRRLRAQGGDPGAVEELRARLREEVAAAFAARQDARRRELETLRARLERVAGTIEAREAARERIIEHRVEVLLDPELAWESGATRAPAPRTSPARAILGGALPGRLAPPAPLGGTAGGAPRTADAAGAGTMPALPGLPGFGTSSPAVPDPLATLGDLHAEFLEHAAALRLSTGSGARLDAERHVAVLRDELATRVELLELDVRAAELRIQQTEATYRDAEQRFRTGTCTRGEMDRARTELELARIDLERQKTILGRYVELARRIEDTGRDESDPRGADAGGGNPAGKARSAR